MTRFSGIKGLLRFRRDLMHTAFEVILAPGPDPAVAEQAAHEAFRTAENLELEFSRFIPNSDVSRINKLEAGASVRVCADTYECIRRGLEIQAMTGGAFDVTAGSGGEEPDEESSDSPNRIADSPRLVLNRDTFEVRVLSRALLDLGGIGKGYAVDRMIDVLKEWDIADVLVHGGQSAVVATGRPEGLSGWPVTLRRPAGVPDFPVPEAETAGLIRRMELSERAMAASGLEKGLHIIDPRTGHPAQSRIAAWAFADDAATADGLSTAFMVMEPEAVLSFCRTHPDVQAILVTDEGEVFKSDNPGESPWDSGDLPAVSSLKRGE